MYDVQKIALNFDAVKYFNKLSDVRRFADEFLDNDKNITKRQNDVCFQIVISSCDSKFVADYLK